MKLLVLSFATVSDDAVAKDLVDAKRSGDFAEAYCIMWPLADLGDADARYNL